MHGRYGLLGGLSVVERHETEALGHVRVLVYEHLGRDDGAEWEERGRQVGVGELLGQVVDEQVAAVRSWNNGSD